MTKVKGIVNEIRINGEKELIDQIFVEKVLRCLPKKFEMVVIAIPKLKNLIVFSIEELNGSLLSHEARMNLDVGTLEHAFQSKISMDKGRGKGFHGRRGHGRGRSLSKYKS